MNIKISLILFLLFTNLFAGSVEKPELDKSVEAELKSFTVAEGYEVNLFASEKDGIANPITMRWDAKGRLWVLCSWDYPQIKSTKEANDKLLILEDTDLDGKADKTTVFADKLHMPMGFALGEGGVFIAAGRDLLFLKDKDGDDRADSREIYFTGFGTGDTHQNINSLTWSPDGELYFTQGLHSFSRVDTPWGIVRLDEHGAWRLRPRRRQLQAFPRIIGGGNPWGIEFGSTGEVFVKSNGRSFGDLLPALIPDYTGLDGVPSVGETKVKSMIVKKIDSPHFSEDIQGDILIAGYMAGDINRLTLNKNGSSFGSTLKENLLDSTSRSFRPVDIQIGPAGALYIADWFNPIIGHYQASLRHPDRDKTHGRIWRITEKNRPLAERPELVSLNIEQLLEKLSSSRSWERYHAKRLLSQRDTPEVVSKLQKWVLETKVDEELLEALYVLASHEIVDAKLLNRLLISNNDQIRGVAVRMIGRWADRLANPLDLLKVSIKDKAPRVRLEAMVAASNVKDAESIKVILNILDQKCDTTIYSSLQRSLKALQPIWEPALMTGVLKIESSAHLAYLIKNMQGTGQYDLLAEGVDISKLDKKSLIDLLLSLVKNPNPRFQSKVFELGKEFSVVLKALSVKKVKPHVDFSGDLKDMVLNGNNIAMDLLGAWEYHNLLPLVMEKINSTDDSSMRLKAINTYAKLQKMKALPLLKKICQTDSSIPVRVASFLAIYKLDEKAGSYELPALFDVVKSKHDVNHIVKLMLKTKSGIDRLYKVLGKNKPSQEVIDMIRGSFVSSGQSTLKLDSLFINSHDNVVGIPTFSLDIIEKTVQKMRSQGDIVKGKAVYNSAKASCVACHKIKGTGGILGPDLSAVGNALSAELIVESVLWPKRQLKEGYVSTTFTTKQGSLIKGNVVTENEKTMVVKDFLGKEKRWDKKQIKKREPDGTLMPEGLVASMTQDELTDMLTYLTSLK